MHTPETPKRAAHTQALVYLIALAVYTLAIYGPFLWAPPLPEGLDPARHFPMSSFPLWQVRALNVLLLYLASASVFFLTYQLVGRPMWLASFAAVLFMANPVKGEVVYALDGSDQLRQVALELLALAVYIYGWQRLSFTAMALAGVALYIRLQVAPLALVVLWPLLLLHVLAPEVRRQGNRLTIGCLLLGLLAVVFGAIPLEWKSPMPVLLTLYPIGLLPETIAVLARYPLLEALLCGGSVLIFVLIYRKSQHPALLFGGAGALGYWWLSGPQLVDPVTLQGGGALLMPAALVSVGLAGLVHSILRHPKWFRPMVLLTALWCVVYFVLQVRAGMAWTPSE